jgi:uncharacterized C2H2 Zn-finger protein
VSFRTGNFAASPATKPTIFTSPPRCPGCGGVHTVSTDKVPDGNSYWRCIRCQEVWSPDRLIGRPVQRFR